MDDEVRRLLQHVAEDESLPPSTITDAELLEKCQAAPKSPRDLAATVFRVLRRTIGVLRAR